jgi:hypothetical protein
MKIEFGNSFFDSLRTLSVHQTWWYKSYETIRYGVPRFFKNVWRFKNELYEFYPWDYSYNLSIFRRSLELTADNIEKSGWEVQESRMKKVAKMREAIEILKRVRSNSYTEMAEAELGDLIMHDWEFEDVEDRLGYVRLVDKDTPEEREHNGKVFERSRQIEEQDWKRLWKIIQGQDHNKYAKNYQKIKGTVEAENYFEKWFDGSGIRNWWD